jgi:hypothetical protein
MPIELNGEKYRIYSNGVKYRLQKYRKDCLIRGWTDLDLPDDFLPINDFNSYQKAMNALSEYLHQESGRHEWKDVTAPTETVIE